MSRVPRPVSCTDASRCLWRVDRTRLAGDGEVKSPGNYVLKNTLTSGFSDSLSKLQFTHLVMRSWS